MDNPLAEALRLGAAKLGVPLAEGGFDALTGYATELLRWNEKFNLTAITHPQEVADKHLLDSLAVLPEVQSATHLLDLGAGAGLPGIPLAVACPGLQATLVDAVAKKVSFMKAGLVKAGLAGRVRAVHARAAGAPQNEGLPTVDLVVSRAFMDVGPFLLLARHYLAAGGRVVCMLGQTPDQATLEGWGHAAGLDLTSRRVFTLPLSGDPRGVAVFSAR